MTERTLFEELGGEPRLRAIIDRFVDRNFDDPMIGFFFNGVSRERLKQKEYEFAAEHLGAPIAYRGRPIAEAHGRHPIMGGQFMRRLQILKDTLSDFDVPEHIRRHWVEHTEALRPQVTRDSESQCDPESALAKVEEHRVRRESSKDRKNGERPTTAHPEEEKGV
jgi:truncated hemoglobin YjbI